MSKANAKIFKMGQARDLLFVLILTSILFYVMSVVSYSPLDSALNTANFPSVAVKNQVGNFGASLSAFVIYYFGIGAFIIPIPLILLSVSNFYRRLSWSSSLLYFFGPMLFFVSLIYFMNHFIPFINLSNLRISTTGRFGLWFDSTVYSQFGVLGSFVLAALFGLLGSFVLLWNERLYNDVLVALKRLRKR